MKHGMYGVNAAHANVVLAGPSLERAVLTTHWGHKRIHARDRQREATSVAA